MNADEDGLELRINANGRESEGKEPPVNASERHPEMKPLNEESA